MKNSLIKSSFLIIVIVLGLYLLQKGAPYFSGDPLVINTEEHSTWKTFTNTEFNFSLQHPSDWTASEDLYPYGNDTLFHLVVLPTDERDPTQTRITVSSKDLSTYTKDVFKENEHPNFSLERYNSITLNGIDGTFLKYRWSNGCWSTNYLFEKSSLTYDIFFLGCVGHPEEYDQLREDIANTFKLLP